MGKHKNHEETSNDKRLIQITKVIQPKNYERPIILYFQNGQLCDTSNLSSAVFKDASTGKTTVAVATEKMLYTGVVKNDPDCNFYALLGNLEKSEGRLMLTDHAVLVPNFLEDTHADNPSEVDSSKRMSSLLELKTHFGSKRTKRIAETHARLNVNVENVKEQLEQTVATIEIENVELQPKPESTFLPKIHRDAKTVQEIYPVEELVPTSVLQAIDANQKDLLNCDLDELGLHSFLRRRFLRLQQASWSEDTELIYRILIYMNHLMTFINMPAKTMTKTMRICQIKKVNDFILDTFTVLAAVRRTRPLTLRDKAICDLLVLSMHTMNFVVSAEDFAADIKLSTKRVWEIGRALCMSQMTVEKRRHLTLKLPLPAPLSIHARRNKRRTI